MTRTCLALMTDAFGGRGGMARYNRDLAAALAGVFDRVDVLVRVAPDPPGPLPSGVRQLRARANRIAYAVTAFALALRRRPAVLLCGHLYMTPLADILSRLTGARVVLQTHGVEAWNAPDAHLLGPTERADLILAVSRATRERVLAWAAVAPERVRALPNTVGEAFQPGEPEASRAALGLDGRFVILTVGRLAAGERYKGHDRIIPLLRNLEAEGLSPLFLVVGEGDDRPRLEALVRQHGAEDLVRFLGHVPEAALPEVYRAADLFVLPSLGEGFGIVLLEAAASGVPVLALDAAGARDALADGALGLLAHEADLAGALVRACHACRAGALKAGAPLAAETLRRFGRPAFEHRLRAALAAASLA